MEREHALRPTGRRTMTAAMIAAQAALPGQWEPAARGRALSALKRAAPALAIPRRVVELVDLLVGHTQAADWAEAGARPVAWPSNADLQDALGLGRSQVCALIRLGQEWGLFEMDDGPGGRRGPVRVEDGPGERRVVEARGFDLTPLAARRAEFEQAAAAHRERRREGKRLRGRIAALGARVQSLAEAGAAQGTPGADWAALAAEARALVALRGEGEDPAQLAPLAERLTALRDAAKAALAAAVPATEGAPAAVPAAVEGGETGPSGPADRTPCTTPTPNLMSANALTVTATAAGAGPDRPQAHETLRGQERPSLGGSGQRTGRPGPGTTTPAATTPASALRGFVLVPEDIVQWAPAFRPWVGSARPSWGELAEAAGYVRAELDISRHAWGQACVLLGGRMEAVAALAVVATRHARGEVRSPEALLRKMVELHQAGLLRLDKSLFGLMDRPREGQGRAETPGADRRRP